MFNAVCKIPMQFFILSIGVLLFVTYQFEKPPVYFDQVAWTQHAAQKTDAPAMHEIENKFSEAHSKERQKLALWMLARHSGNRTAEASALSAVASAHDEVQAVRQEARLAVDPHDKRNDTDYIFITYILDHFPHGLIGLLVATFFAAALSAKAAELNALGSATIVDFYKPVLKPNASEQHYLTASKTFTVFWGCVSITFALCLSLAENLIQAVNIVGALFYPVMLSLFVVGFFIRGIRGTAVYLSSISASLTPPWPLAGGYITTKAALDKMIEAWRYEHPDIGFTRVVVGDCAGGEGHSKTEFIAGVDMALFGAAYQDWIRRGYVAVGSYIVTARVNDGRGGTTTCSVEIRVASRPTNHPPTISCALSPTTVHPGERVRVVAAASDPDNDPLTFVWQSSAGKISGSGAAVDLDTTGVSPTRYLVTGQVDDGRGGTASCQAEFNVETP